MSLSLQMMQVVHGGLNWLTCCLMSVFFLWFAINNEQSV